MVEFGGEHDDVRPFLHAADIFAFPSRGELSGGALIEAMACGLACVALWPDGHGVRTVNAEITEHGRSGLLIDRPTPEAPAAAWGLVCGPMDKRKRLLAILVAYYTVVHMLVLAEPRFHVPLLPVVAILAAHAFAERPWRECARCQRWVAALLVALLLLNWGLEVARDWDTLVALFGPQGHMLRLSY